MSDLLLKLRVKVRRVVEIIVSRKKRRKEKGSRNISLLLHPQTFLHDLETQLVISV